MQKTFEVQGPVELDVRLASGDIDVDPNTEGRVEIELIAHDEESQRLVDNARIELNPHGNRSTVLVDVPQKKGFSISIFGRSGIECRIRCPHESGLSVRTKSADVSARGVLGGLNVQTASGDQRVGSVVAGRVVMQSASGDQTVGVRRGSVVHMDVRTMSGDATSDLEVRDTPLSDDAPMVELRAVSMSGDIHISRA